MIDWEKYNRSQAAISGLGFVEVDIKDYEEIRAALQPVILEQPTGPGLWLVCGWKGWEYAGVSVDYTGTLRCQFIGDRTYYSVDHFNEWLPARSLPS